MPFLFMRGNYDPIAPSTIPLPTNSASSNGLYFGDSTYITGVELGDNSIVNSSSTIAYLSTPPTFHPSVFVGGNIGIATSTPAFLLDLYSTATTTARLDSNSSTQGSCLIMKDSDGVGYTYITAANGVLTASVTPCN